MLIFATHLGQVADDSRYYPPNVDRVSNRWNAANRWVKPYGVSAFLSAFRRVFLSGLSHVLPRVAMKTSPFQHSQEGSALPAPITIHVSITCKLQVTADHVFP